MENIKQMIVTQNNAANGQSTSRSRPESWYQNSRFHPETLSDSTKNGDYSDLPQNEGVLRMPSPTSFQTPSSNGNAGGRSSSPSLARPGPNVKHKSESLSRKPFSERLVHPDLFQRFAD